MKIAFVFNRKTDDSLEQAEFDTDDTIQAVHAALASGGHQVINIEMNLKSGVFDWVRQLKEAEPDLIFNTAEGYFGIGRESLGPTIFEQLQIPYVGSGPYGCFLTLDKFLTKQMVALRKVPVIDGYFFNSIEELQTISREMVYPAFIKPNYEGSSKGITAKSICKDADELLAVGEQCLKQFPQGVLVERYIYGRDISVPFISGLGEGGVLEPLEYVYTAKSKGELNIYDYELKNKLDEAVVVQCPAPLEASQRKSLLEMMRKVVPILGVVDFARADFRMSPEGDIYFLELNALPSLQVGAGIFEATKLLGLDYNQTILKIVEAAKDRLNLAGRYSKSPHRLVSTKKPKVALVYNLKRKKWGDPEYEKEAEFDSLHTVKAIQTTIEKFGCQVVPIEATKTLGELLKENKIDVVFNIAEGSNKRAREAQVPAICDLLGIEHTGSDATSLAITLDKALTKKIVSQDGILTPKYKLFQNAQVPSDFNLQFPVIVKPNTEGTSKGIDKNSVVQNKEELVALLKGLWEKFKSPILCEEYIVGREFTIGLLGNSTVKMVGPMEIIFKSQSGSYPVYSFEAKQEQNPFDNPLFEIKCPVSFGKELDKKIISTSKKIFNILGCRDVARIDFRLSEKGEIYFLEINPLPGLSPGFSDLTVMAERSQVSYDLLIKRILAPAIQRWRQAGRGR